MTGVFLQLASVPVASSILTQKMLIEIDSFIQILYMKTHIEMKKTFSWHELSCKKCVSISDYFTQV